MRASSFQCLIIWPIWIDGDRQEEY
jgi:hypothetical protein